MGQRENRNRQALNVKAGRALKRGRGQALIRKITIKITRELEQVANGDDVKVETGIGLFDTGIGHVLEAIADAPM